MTRFILRQSIIFLSFFPVPIVWRQFDSSYVMVLPLIQHTLEETRELAGILASKNNKFRKSSKCNEITKRLSHKLGGLSRGQKCRKQQNRQDFVSNAKTLASKNSKFNKRKNYKRNEKYDNPFARQNHNEPVTEFPLAPPSSGIFRHLSGSIGRYSHSNRVQKCDRSTMQNLPWRRSNIKTWSPLSFVVVIWSSSTCLIPDFLFHISTVFFNLKLFLLNVANLFVSCDLIWVIWLLWDCLSGVSRN